MGFMLVIIGVLLAAAGGILMVLEKAGWKGLPGDILLQKGSTTFFFPIISCIVISIILSVILNIWRR